LVASLYKNKSEMMVIVKRFGTYVFFRNWAFLKEILLFLGEVGFSPRNNHVPGEELKFYQGTI
jgi:hypothetical protein